jgi:hypothetical protein
MTTDECAVLVDAAARRIWGRGLWQELDADVEAAEAVGATLRSQIGVEPLCDAFDATLKLRRRMLEAVKAEGPAAMSPRAFAASWEDRLLPLLVHVHPGGAIWDPPNQPTVEYGGALQRENGEVVDAWGWGWRVEPEDEVTDRFALDVDAARYLLTQAAPLAKLALNGRGHDLMLEQELEDELGRLASAGLDCRIHPDFAASPDRPRTAREQALRSYAKILRHDSFQCDITGDSIGVDEGVLLRAGEFRRSPLLARFRDAVGDAAAADHFLRRNWSDWIVRADLLQ